MAAAWFRNRIEQAPVAELCVEHQGGFFHDSPCKYGFSYDCVSLGVYLFELLCPGEDVGEYYLHSSAVSAAHEAAGGSDWRAVHMKLVAANIHEVGE